MRFLPLPEHAVNLSSLLRQIDAFVAHHQPVLFAWRKLTPKLPTRQEEWWAYLREHPTELTLFLSAEDHLRRNPTPLPIEGILLHTDWSFTWEGVEGPDRPDTNPNFEAALDRWTAANLDLAKYGPTAGGAFYVSIATALRVEVAAKLEALAVRPSDPTPTDHPVTVDLRKGQDGPPTVTYRGEVHAVDDEMAMFLHALTRYPVGHVLSFPEMCRIHPNLAASNRKRVMDRIHDRFPGLVESWKRFGYRFVQRPRG